MSKNNKPIYIPLFGINIKRIRNGYDCCETEYEVTYKGQPFYTTKKYPDDLIGHLETFFEKALEEERKKYENKNNDSYSYLRDLSYRKLVNKDNEKNVTDVILNTYKIYKGNQFLGEVVEEPKELIDNLNKFCK